MSERENVVEVVARAHYAEITRRVAAKFPGAPFKTWEQLPAEQRDDQMAAIRAAMSADHGMRMKVLESGRDDVGHMRMRKALKEIAEFVAHSNYGPETLIREICLRGLGEK